MQKIIGILVLLLSATQGVQAQVPGFSFEKYTTANGLTDNNAHQVLQDSRGFLWIGTSNGLNRFDGNTFKQYNSYGKNGLTDLSVNCITEDGEGNIWIGTKNGLNRLDPFTEIITHFYEGSGPGTIPYKWCNYLYTDKNKQLWLGTEKGIALYNRQTSSFQNYPLNLYGADVRINKFIDGILEDSKGRFWLATSFGVKKFDRTHKTVHSFHFSETRNESLKENAIISLFEDKMGTIWAGTWGGGLIRFNETEAKFEKFAIPHTANTSVLINDISQIQVHNIFYLLVTVNGSLYSLDETAADPRAIPVVYENSDAPVPEAFTNLLSDGKETLWASSNSGLYKLQPQGRLVNWATFSEVNTTNNYVWHIIPDIDAPQHIFYLSTVKGWWKYEMDNKKLSVMPLPARGNQLLRFINSWVPDDGGYWFTSVEGFGYFNLHRNKVTNLTHLIEKYSGQQNTGYVVKDNKGKLWVTMRRNGILVYDPLLQKATPLFADTAKQDNIFGQSVTSLACGEDGAVYFCAAYKLYRADPSDFSYRIITAPPYEEQIDAAKTGALSIIVTTGNRILVSSQLRIYELKNNKLVSVFPKTELSNFSIEKIIAGYNNTILVVTSKGNFKTDDTFKKWQRIYTGTQDNGYEIPEMLMTAPGTVLFNGMGGIGTLNDTALHTAAVPPRVIISNIKYGLKQQYLPSLQPVTIRSSYKDAIEIELAAIDFVNGKENTVLYHLDGWDKEWKELKGTAVVRYEQLPAGNYVFKTKTVNTEGDESVESQINFAIIPPFYRTWWFITAAAFLVTGLLFWVYRYRLQKALEMEKLRIRIATDLHDDIGATLSSISMYSEVIKDTIKEKLPHLEPVLNKMGENSREMVNSISDIVWAINPENDEGEKLVQRMENYARDICAVKNIRLLFNTSEKMKMIILPLEHRKNIYLVFKEALNNALKYAEAKTICISIDHAGHTVHLAVEDDGRGFDTAIVKKGNGLKNITARVSEIGGTLKIISSENAGTKIELLCSL